MGYMRKSLLHQVFTFNLGQQCLNHDKVISIVRFYFVTYQVEEPGTAPLNVQIRLSREGTSGQAIISWTLMGTGEQAAQVTSTDVSQMEGTVIMLSGLGYFLFDFCK